MQQHHDELQLHHEPHYYSGNEQKQFINGDHKATASDADVFASVEASPDVQQQIPAGTEETTFIEGDDGWGLEASALQKFGDQKQLNDQQQQFGYQKQVYDQQQQFGDLQQFSDQQQFCDEEKFVDQSPQFGNQKHLDDHHEQVDNKQQLIDHQPQFDGQQQQLQLGGQPQRGDQQPSDSPQQQLYVPQSGPIDPHAAHPLQITLPLQENIYNVAVTAAFANSADATTAAVVETCEPLTGAAVSNLSAVPSCLDAQQSDITYSSVDVTTSMFGHNVPYHSVDATLYMSDDVEPYPSAVGVPASPDHSVPASHDAPCTAGRQECSIVAAAGTYEGGHAAVYEHQLPESIANVESFNDTDDLGNAPSSGPGSATPPDGMPPAATPVSIGGTESWGDWGEEENSVIPAGV